MSDRPVGRTLPKYRTEQHRINAYTHQTSMPEVGFEPTITASVRTKTVPALDRAATVAGQCNNDTHMSIRTAGRQVVIRNRALCQSK
jgi:hypothetical protein